MIKGLNNGNMPQNSGFGFIEKITNKDLEKMNSGISFLPTKGDLTSGGIVPNDDEKKDKFFPDTVTIDGQKYKIQKEKVEVKNPGLATIMPMYKEQEFIEIDGKKYPVEEKKNLNNLFGLLKGGDKVVVVDGQEYPVKEGKSPFKRPDVIIFDV